MTDHEAKWQAIGGNKGRYLQYLYNTMPASDKAMYPPALFEEFAAHADMLRQNVAWCAALPEEMFLNDVLYHRINDEDISSHRPLFYEKLFDRIKQLNVKESVLEANRWCHEHVTYEAQDNRTASPLTVYRAGTGRCGEESTFLVAVLRSVGIAARQVYAPWWSHCDDNHAWVEAYCDDGWYFLGACEPEPVLNRGWFNTAASRGLLEHSRQFGGGQTTPADGAPLGRQGCALYRNQTGRYAITRACTFKVQRGGVPVPGALVRLLVLNEAALRPIATLQTDENGQVALSLGKGDVWVEAVLGQGHVEQLCPAGRQSSFVLDFEQPQPAAGWQEFDFTPPADAPVNPAPLSPAQKAERARVMQRGNQLRQSRMQSFYNQAKAAAYPVPIQDILQKSRGNFEPLCTWLQQNNTATAHALLQTLSDKDYRDVTPAALQDHLEGAQAFAEQYPQAIFEQYLLCPRIANEPLTPWRSVLAAAFTTGQKRQFAAQPALLYKHLQQTIAVVEEKSDYPLLYWPPNVALAAGCCNSKSLAVLCVAVLRAIGVPARLHPVFGPQVWQNGNFVPVVQEAVGSVVLKKQPRQQFAYRQNWGLMRWQAGGWEELELEEENWTQNQLQLTLPQGRYRLITSVRLPNGNQFAARHNFMVAVDAHLAIPMHLREYCLGDILARRPMPGFSALDASGELVANPAPAAGKCGLLCWLEEGAEPTEHVLNELMAAKESLQNLPVEILFFVRNKQALAQPTLAALLKNWPAVRVYTAEWEYNIEHMARFFSCDPDRPPLCIVCDDQGNGVYANSGYNVGMVELCVGIIKHINDIL